MLEGFKIAATMMALVLALTTANALGLSAAAGVDLGTADLDQDTVASTNADLKNPQAEALGQQDPTFLGIGVGITMTLNQLWILVSRVGPILSSWGVHPAISYSVQIMVDFTFALGVIQVLRGVIFR